MKKLYTLGDSFMSLDDPSDGIVSFSELYCQHRGFKHVSLARPGATNFSIRLQIEKAVQDCADYVLIGTTCSDRFDVCLRDNDYVEGTYSIHNVHYQNYRSASQKHIDQEDVQLVCDTFINIQREIYYSIDSYKKQALEYYISFLHDVKLQSQKDYYIISDGLRLLQKHNIDFVLLPGWMDHYDWSWVKCVWPADKSPYNMPYGIANWTNPPKFTQTHNPSWAHEEFCQTLISLTQDWSND